MRTKVLFIIALLCSAVEGMCSDFTYLNRTWNGNDKKVEQSTETFDNCMILVSDNRVVELPGNVCKWYVALGNLNIKELKVIGNVNLLLADGARLETNHISLGYGNTLHIYGQSNDSGQLIVNQTETGYAGIGGGPGKSDGYVNDARLGELHVHGGTLTVQGGKYGAGIGGGDNGYAGRYFQYGGTVTATGGDYGAGIGSGDEPYQYYNNVGWSQLWGYTCIYGGKLTATGGEDAAGIGGGNEMQGSNVDIWGGEVTAYGNTYAAGIGAGDSPIHGNRCSINIYGGKVTAYGGDGSGNKFWGIDEGGAGIGSGDGASHRETITITGGTVYAKGGRYAPGIGSSYRCSFGTLHITGGNITAISGADWGQSIYAAYPTIAQGMKTMAGNSADALTIAPYASNYKECEEHTNSTVQPCTEHNYTYSIVNADKHRAVCLYCNHTEEQSHVYEGNSDCVCGQHDGSNDVFTITVFTSADGTTFESLDYSVVRSRGLVMPKPAAIDGLTFMGYLQTSTEPATGVEMADADITSLVDAGQTVTPTADATYYARYRYDYIPTWTWTDDGPTAACSISRAVQGDNLESINIDISYLAEDETSRVEPTADADGAAFYNATATYQRAEGVTYQFTDQYIKVLHSTGPVAVTLYNTTGNNKTLERYDGRIANVTLSGRTLYRDGRWNTIYLPFNLKDFTGTPLEGATVKTATSSSFENGTLTIYFYDYPISAGVPYIVKWTTKGDPIENPVFMNVKIDKKGYSASAPDYVSFRGSYSPIDFEADNTVLYVGYDATSSKSKLYYPSKAMTIGAFCGYFQLKNGLTAVDVAHTRMVFDSETGETGETTSLKNNEQRIMNSEQRIMNSEAGAWYDLQGRRVANGQKPAAKGLYIRNGKKEIIK